MISAMQLNAVQYWDTRSSRDATGPLLILSGDMPTRYWYYGRPSATWIVELLFWLPPPVLIDTSWYVWQLLESTRKQVAPLNTTWHNLEGSSGAKY